MGTTPPVEASSLQRGLPWLSGADDVLLLAPCLDDAVDDGGEATGGVAVAIGALGAQGALTQDEVRLHRALALHLDQAAFLRLVAPRFQELQQVYVCLS